MVGSVIAPALPAIAENLQFRWSPSLLVTLPSLGVVLFSPIIGKSVNYLGPYKLLIIGLIPYALLGFLGAFIDSNMLLIVDRLLLGAACVAIQVSVTTFIAQLFEGKDRLKLIAWQGMAIEFGGVVFLAIGGVLGELGWQYPFYIYLVALVFFLFTWKSIPKNITPSANQKSSQKSFDKRVIPILTASILSMMLFFICYVNLPAYLPSKFNFTESETGYFMSFISLIAVLVASQLPRLTEKSSAEKLNIIGFISFVVGYLLFAFSPSSWLMIFGAFSIGIGFGLTIPLLNHMIVEVSNHQTRGKNLGLYSMMVFGGQFLATFSDMAPLDTNLMFYYTAVIAVAFTIVQVVLFKKMNIT